MPRSRLTRLLFRLLPVCFALISMLAMQCAVAAYACPMAKANGAEATALAPAMTDMANCSGHDSAQPGLCHLHAQADSARQTADTPQLPAVQPFFPAALVATLQCAAVDASRSSVPVLEVSLTRSTAPPLVIRHCCFLL